MNFTNIFKVFTKFWCISRKRLARSYRIPNLRINLDLAWRVFSVATLPPYNQRITAHIIVIAQLRLYYHLRALHTIVIV